MHFTAGQIAEYLKGTVEGDSEVTVDDVSRIEEGRQGTLTFLSNLKYEKYLYTTKASVVLVNREFTPSKRLGCTLIRVDDAYQAIAALLQLREQMKPAPAGVTENAFVDSSAITGKNVYIGHFSVISKGVVIGDSVIIHSHSYIGENVTIGNNTVIHPGVKIYHDSVIGKECTLHAGVVIGSDGFGFAPQTGMNYKKIPQVGNVVIEDQVEIGANCTIDRAMIGSTIIRRGVKLDNLIQVAHNVEIGENTVIAAQSGIAGSTRIGAGCMIGGQAGIVGHLNIADGTRIAAQSGVGGSINEKDTTVQGSPSFRYSSYQRSYVFFRKLPQIYSRLERIERELGEAGNRKKE
ncbi:MAG: UDP-3-O-(3-hydroxymyristoyl)glucosamine N-acyltransferase [Marinilabiliales bacterium]|nr:MAG: UDP-3-O-(3-hydroxymyristoyl)glucosamine N-acyltransferase [Marinilabiliales bacterium]